MTKLSGNMREVGGQIVGEGVGEIVLLGVAAQIGERQHDDRQARRVRELDVRDGRRGSHGRGHGGGANLRQPNHPAAMQDRDERGGDAPPSAVTFAPVARGPGYGTPARLSRRAPRRTPAPGARCS